MCPRSLVHSYTASRYKNTHLLKLNHACMAVLSVSGIQVQEKVSDIFPSEDELDLIRDIKDFSEEMIVFVDFFESNHNYQVIFTK